MALIVEDGSIVAGANTYLTIAEADTILDDKFGIVPTTALTEKDLKLAAQYLESFRTQYLGQQVSPSTQTLEWPRVDVLINCVLQASDEIPEELKVAQALAAYEESLGNTLQPTTSGQSITQKSIAGQISVSYSDNGLDSGVKIFRQVDQYLTILFKKQNSQSVVFRA